MVDWDFLGIEPTSDERQIKRAYSRKLKEHHPEDDPEGYQRLRETYEAAKRYAKLQAQQQAAFSWDEEEEAEEAYSTAETGSDEDGTIRPYRNEGTGEDLDRSSEEVPPVDPYRGENYQEYAEDEASEEVPLVNPYRDENYRDYSSEESRRAEMQDDFSYRDDRDLLDQHGDVEDSFRAFVNQAEDLYNNFAERINAANWTSLLNSDAAWDFRLRDRILSWAMEFIAGRPYLPQEIKELLAEHYQLAELDEDFYETYIKTDQPLFRNAYIADQDIDHDLFIELRLALYAALHERNIKAAAELKDRALAIFNRDPDLLVLAAEYYLQKGDTQQELALMENCYAVLPEDLQIQRRLATVLYQSGQYDRAIAFCEKHLEELPADQVLLSVLGKSYFETDRMKQADAIFKQLLEIDLNDLEALFYGTKIHKLNYQEQGTAERKKKNRDFDGISKKERQKLVGQYVPKVQIIASVVLILIFALMLIKPLALLKAKQELATIVDVKSQADLTGIEDPDAYVVMTLEEAYPIELYHTERTADATAQLKGLAAGKPVDEKREGYFYKNDSGVLPSIIDLTKPDTIWIGQLPDGTAFIFQTGFEEEYEAGQKLVGKWHAIPDNNLEEQLRKGEARFADQNLKELASLDYFVDSTVDTYLYRAHVYKPGFIFYLQVAIELFLIFILIRYVLHMSRMRKMVTS